MAMFTRHEREAGPFYVQRCTIADEEIVMHFETKDAKQKKMRVCIIVLALVGFIEFQA